MVAVVQLVRASDCGSECRGFESHLPPKISPYKLNTYEGFFINGSRYLETEIRLSRNLGSADSSIKTSWNSYLNLYFITIHDEN